MDSAVLTDLLATGNYEQTITQAKQFLQSDPDDPIAHSCLGYSYIGIGDTAKAAPHVDFTLSSAPNESNSHLLAILYYRALGDRYRVGWHCDTGMQLDPGNSVFYFFAAQEAAAKYDVVEAQRLISRAIELDPEDPDYRHFAIHMDGVTNNSLTSSWEKIEQFKETLKLDPENAGIHHSIGDVYLDEIKDPKQAEIHFRDALRLKPSNANFQRSLFQAVAQRDLLYRLLSIPSRAFSWVENVCRAITIQPWRLIFVFFLFKGILVGAMWLVLATFFLAASEDL